jgi:hypothetical protein
VESQKRHYQDEFLIHQTTGQHFELGETVGFITVLIPHPAAESPLPLVDQISLLSAESARDGMGVRVKRDDKELFIAVKCDLRQDMSRDWRRPKYTFESGKNTYGDFETDGDFLFASLEKGQLNYTIVNLTKALYKGQVLVEALPWESGLTFDASPDQAGFGKLRYWRGGSELKGK